MADIFDTHADSYSEDIDKVLGKYGANHDFFTAHKAWLINDLLKRNGRRPADMALLDVGCGVGKIHAALKGDFKAIAGVDVSLASLDEARKAHPEVEYKSYDGLRLPYSDDTFELSIAICVFHHVPPKQWAGLAAEMLRVLRPGGISLIIEHNPYNPVTRRIVNTCPLDKDAVLLSPAKLKGLFRKASGAGVVSRTILSVPPKTAFLKRMDGVLGVLPFGAQYYMIARKRSSQSTPHQSVDLAMTPTGPQ